MPTWQVQELEAKILKPKLQSSSLDLGDEVACAFLLII